MSRRTVAILVAIILIGLLLAVIVSQRQGQPIIVVTPTPTPTISPAVGPTSIPTPMPTITPTTSPLPTGSTPSPQQSANIMVTTPTPNQIVSSPLIITGQARGSWFFEAVAPARLVDGSGRTLAQGNITAQGDSQTNNFVPFTGQLTFSSPSTNTGQLILQNDNPSGLPQNSQQFTIPVRFR